MTSIFWALRLCLAAWRLSNAHALGGDAPLAGAPGFGWMGTPDVSHSVSRVRAHLPMPEVAKFVTGGIPLGYQVTFVPASHSWVVHTVRKLPVSFTKEGAHSDEDVLFKMKRDIETHANRNEDIENIMREADRVVVLEVLELFNQSMLANLQDINYVFYLACTKEKHRAAWHAIVGEHEVVPEGFKVHRSVGGYCDASMLDATRDTEESKAAVRVLYDRIVQEKFVMDALSTKDRVRFGAGYISAYDAMRLSSWRIRIANPSRRHSLHDAAWMVKGKYKLPNISRGRGGAEKVAAIYDAILSKGPLFEKLTFAEQLLGHIDDSGKRFQLIENVVQGRAKFEVTSLFGATKGKYVEGTLRVAAQHKGVEELARSVSKRLYDEVNFTDVLQNTMSFDEAARNLAYEDARSAKRRKKMNTLSSGSL